MVVLYMHTQNPAAFSPLSTFTFAERLCYTSTHYSCFCTESNSQLLGNLLPKSKSTIILPLRNTVVNGGPKMQVPSAAAL